MEKRCQELYDQIKRAYDYPENRENHELAQCLLTASNQLIKNQNPILIARELNNQMDTYFIQDNEHLPKSLVILKDALKNFIEM
ncbi:bacteriocin immunity protein [Streptococcus pseudoporcinus]|uniref:Enterocin A Immunity family protein n=1 Tax=Streptococcus pseudoporcinus TaxID=361101 RepID=A0A4V6L1H3_9STRE|nr:bacteriocin immunity protein [Streptococcus pseudoporcinus]VTS20657.1 enterocin A Immunity family protein [Streptococcus pseudoporcinus]VUC69292.1 enterocin A Immunity family protein [Streptococcus pseudoporcinus]VUC99766.1 enterocin A Immunity family protein [Streptococcus pseudoporcinus]VUD00159.1 enterocin A Immunity family protein [Streptococcus pseudoporcinus]